MKTRSKLSWYPFVVAVIVLGSFFLFSPLYNNQYCSDNAVHVLMACDFCFPRDLYYWGQNRLGSAVPMLAALPAKWLDPVYAVSVVQYLLLLGGFLFFSHFIRKKGLGLMLCIVWFFPLEVFGWHLQIGHPYSAQLFFMGLSLYAFKRHRLVSSSTKSLVYVFVSSLSFMLAVWVNDLTLVLLPLYLLFAILSWGHMQSEGDRIHFSFPARFSRTAFFYTAGFVIGFGFLWLAKNSASLAPADYDMVISPLSGIKQGFYTVTSVMAKALVFKVRNVWVSFHVVFCLLVLLLLLYAKLRGIKSERGAYTRFFLFFSALFTLLAVICSHWAELAQYATRYFIFTYYLAIIFILVAIDRLRHRYWAGTAAGLMMCAVLCSAADAVRTAVRPGRITKHLTVSELRDIGRVLGDCGIIGDYWSSYNLASADPVHIVASARDDGPVRNTALVASLMAKEKIYLVADNWMDTFPPACIEFGYFLEKAGEPFMIHGLRFCRYKNAGRINFPVTSIARRYAQVYTGPDTVIMKTDSLNYVSDFVFYGPWVTLRPGTYCLSAEIGAMNRLHQHDTVKVDFTGMFGQVLLGKKTFALDGCFLFREKLFFRFSVRNPVRKIEMRVFLKGKTQVFLKNITLAREE